MHYIILLYADASFPSTNDEYQRHHEQELRNSGHLLAAVTLAASASTMSLRLQHGEVAVEVGPCMAAQLELQRALLIEARDLNEAIQVASRTPHLHHGPIEIRSVVASSLGDDGGACG